MSDFYSATIFLSVFIMIIMDMLVSGNDLMEHDKKQMVYTISVLMIACMVSEWFGVWMDGADPSLRTLHILVKEHKANQYGNAQHHHKHALERLIPFLFASVQIFHRHIYNSERICPQRRIP